MISHSEFTYQQDRLPFIVTTPSDYSENESLPLIVFLHGAGERGTDLERITVHGIPKLFTKNPDHSGLRVITLSPQCPLQDVWSNHTHTLHALIEQIAREYHADPNRISITGLSMGGFGTWEMICRYPEVFAAAAPICGGGMAWRASAIGDLPIRAFHGDNDDVVSIDYSIRMVSAVNQNGGHANLTILPGVGHDSWTYAYEKTDLISWLATQTRS